MFTGDGGSGGEGGDEVITFANQSELDSAIDKRTEKALATAREKWEKDAKERETQALTEGQRLAQLSEEERRKEAENKRNDSIAKKEADLTRRELRFTALEELTTRELPTELIEAVVLTNAEDCTNSIVAIEKAFRSAVEAGVNDRLARSAANAPGQGGSSQGNDPGALGKRLANANKQQTKQSKFF